MSITVRGMNFSNNPRNRGREERILNSIHDVEPPRPKSLKRFEIGNQIVFALNKKNAERKAKLYPDKEIIGG